MFKKLFVYVTSHRCITEFDQIDMKTLLLKTVDQVLIDVELICFGYLDPFLSSLED